MILHAEEQLPRGLQQAAVLLIKAVEIVTFVRHGGLRPPELLAAFQVDPDTGGPNGAVLAALEHIHIFALRVHAHADHGLGVPRRLPDLQRPAVAGLQIRHIDIQGVVEEIVADQLAVAVKELRVPQRAVGFGVDRHFEGVRQVGAHAGQRHGSGDLAGLGIQQVDPVIPAIVVAVDTLGVIGVIDHGEATLVLRQHDGGGKKDVDGIPPHHLAGVLLQAGDGCAAGVDHAVLRQEQAGAAVRGAVGYGIPGRAPERLAGDGIEGEHVAVIVRGEQAVARLVDGAVGYGRRYRYLRLRDEGDGRGVEIVHVQRVQQHPLGGGVVGPAVPGVLRQGGHGAADRPGGVVRRQGRLGILGQQRGFAQLDALLLLDEGLVLGRDLPVLHQQHADEGRGRHRHHGQRRRQPARAVAPFPLEQRVVGAADQRREQPQLLVVQLAQNLAGAAGDDVGGQGLGAPDQVAVGIVDVHQLVREGFLRPAVRQHHQHVVAVVVLQEIADLPLDPYGLGRLRRADHDQELGVVQRFIDAGGQVAGQGQLVLVPEHPAQAAAAPFGGQPGRNVIALDQLVQPLGDGDVQRHVPVTDKCDVFIHGSGLLAPVHSRVCRSSGQTPPGPRS